METGCILVLKIILSRFGTFVPLDVNAVMNALDLSTQWFCIRIRFIAFILVHCQVELISGDQNGNIRVWDLTSNSCSRELVPDGEAAVRSITIAQDGTKVVAANNRGKCFIWKLGERDTSQFDPLQRIDAHKTYILKCCFSPDAKLLATASADHTVKLWNVKDFSLFKTLTGHQRWVWDCAFAADSAYIVTASSDQVARLWDVNQGETMRTYTGHNKAVVCVALNDSSPEKK
eukprot:TRINITY_DN3373_c0_g1_i1.p1 TRINITY_DN3373_c0_g1~~TRINITY_DN3373_c0_g1_i1.p1  ORF type:complete len:232 (-),score=36.26 TRINITY_DN3373_c0_g1_i1:150-845(-)